jgi:PAS domain S-box-containing protein
MKKQNCIDGISNDHHDLYYALFRTSRDGLVFLDLEGRPLEANEAFLGMVGYSEEQLTARSVADLMSERWLAREAEIIRRQVEERGYSDEYEKELIRKDGSVLPVMARAWMVRDAGGGALRMVNVVRDISEWKRDDEQLQAHIQHLESMEQLSRVMRETIDLESVMTRSLETVLSIFGADRAWLANPCDPDSPSWGVPFEVTVPDYPGLHAAGKDVAMSAGIVRLLEWHRDSDDVLLLGPGGGAELPPELNDYAVKSQISMTLHPRSGLPWVFGLHQCSRVRTWSGDEQRLFRDIGQRITAVISNLLLFRDLQKSEEESRWLVENANEAIVVIQDQMIKRFNARLIEISGYSRGELESLPFVDLVNEKDREKVIERYNRRLDGESSTEVSKLRLVRKGGQMRWAEAKLIRIGWNDQPALLAFINDVTEQRRMESDRCKLAAQVQQAQKMESLGVLTGGIAHDFNNLLTGILGNADLALDDVKPGSPVRERLDEIEKAARRAADLCNQMLAYSGKGQLAVEPLRINELVVEMAHLLEVSISKKVNLRYNFARDLPEINGDAAQIRQVVMNLVSNASEAIGDDRGLITLTTDLQYCNRELLSSAVIDEELPQGNYLVLEVRDTGRGMDEATWTRIFDPFFTTKFQGRGLGLAAVLGIVRGHHGAITLHSTLNEGTAIRVLFPVKDRLAGTVPTADGEVWRGAGTVLLVDDEESVRKVVRKMLEKAGFDVLTARDGLEAMQIYVEQGNDIRLVLLDLTMPQMDGEETFGEIRRIRPDARVVVASGYTEQDVVRRFRGKGISGFVHKPFKFTPLMVVLQKALEGDGFEDGM